VSRQRAPKGKGDALAFSVAVDRWNWIDGIRDQALFPSDLSFALGQEFAVDLASLGPKSCRPIIPLHWRTLRMRSGAM
jgi:hypothetical protein